LTGSSREQVLLNLMPSDAIVTSASTHRRSPTETARSKIRLACSYFERLAVAIA
jgi:hypothetical protein